MHTWFQVSRQLLIRTKGVHLENAPSKEPHPVIFVARSSSSCGYCSPRAPATGVESMPSISSGVFGFLSAHTNATIPPMEHSELCCKYTCLHNTKHCGGSSATFTYLAADGLPFSTLVKHLDKRARKTASPSSPVRLRSVSAAVSIFLQARLFL